MGDQVLRLLRKRGAGADEVVGFAGVGDEVVGFDGLREVVDGDHLPAVGAYAMGSVPPRVSKMSNSQTIKLTLLANFSRAWKVGKFYSWTV